MFKKQWKTLLSDVKNTNQMTNQIRERSTVIRYVANRSDERKPNIDTWHGIYEGTIWNSTQTFTRIRESILLIYLFVDLGVVNNSLTLGTLIMGSFPNSIL